MYIQHTFSVVLLQLLLPLVQSAIKKHTAVLGGFTAGGSAVLEKKFLTLHCLPIVFLFFYNILVTNVSYHILLDFVYFPAAQSSQMNMFGWCHLRSLLKTILGRTVQWWNFKQKGKVVLRIATNKQKKKLYSLCLNTFSPKTEVNTSSQTVKCTQFHTAKSQQNETKPSFSDEVFFFLCSSMVKIYNWLHFIINKYNIIAYSCLVLITVTCSTSTSQEKEKESEQNKNREWINVNSTTELNAVKVIKCLFFSSQAHNCLAANINTVL